MDSSKVFSSVVTSLRFPLMLMVLLIHTQPIPPETLGSDYNVYIYVATLIKEVFTRMAVPAFFVFSGYYAFKGKNLEQPSVYLSETSKRVWTLLIPYLLWNLVYILATIAGESLATRVGFARAEAFVFSWSKLSDYFWFSCINYPLWFIRDLIVLTLITPLIHFVLRVTRGYIVPLFFLLCICIPDPFRIIGAEPRSLLFYSTGALFAMKAWSPIDKLKPLALPSFIIWGIGTFILPCIFTENYFRAVELPYLVCSIIAWILLFAMLVKKAPKFIARLQKLNKYVFFLYAAHAILIIGFARSIILRFSFFSKSNIGLILSHLIIAGITLFIVLFVYKVLERIAPKCLSILCGGRAS